MEFVEVEGVVTLDGKPLANVEVVFLPDPEHGTIGPRSACYTDAEGKYRLRCEWADREGTVIGVHRVCLHDITALPTPADALTESRFEGSSLPQVSSSKPFPRHSRVPAKYSDSRQTPFRGISVERGKQTVNLELKTAPL